MISIGETQQIEMNRVFVQPLISHNVVFLSNKKHIASTPKKEKMGRMDAFEGLDIFTSALYSVIYFVANPKLNRFQK